MPSWVNTRNVNTGDYFDAQAWNNIVAPNGSLSYFSSLTNATNTVVLVAQAGQSVANATDTVITWTSAPTPNTDMWTSGSEIILPSAGIFYIGLDLRYSTTAGQTLRYTILDYSTNNGGSYLQIFYDNWNQAVTTNSYLFWYSLRNRISSGGRIRVRTRQDSTLANVLVANMTVQKIGDLFDY